MCSWTLLHCLSGPQSTRAGKGIASPLAHWWLRKFATQPTLDLGQISQLVRSTILQFPRILEQTYEWSPGVHISSFVARRWIHCCTCLDCCVVQVWLCKRVRNSDIPSQWLATWPRDKSHSIRSFSIHWHANWFLHHWDLSPFDCSPYVIIHMWMSLMSRSTYPAAKSMESSGVNHGSRY